MPVVEVKNLKGEVVGELTLSDVVFNRPFHPALVYDAIRWFQAKRRAGTAATKTRGEVTGSGRKLWRQKGTGRARVGSIRSPLWRHGGTIHGPRPRDYSYELPTKMRRAALLAVVSERLREGRLLVVDAFDLETHKTKAFVQVLTALGLTGHRALIIDEEPENRNLQRAARNIPTVRLVPSYGINVYDALAHEMLVFSRKAIIAFEKRMKRADGERP